MGRHFLIGLRPIPDLHPDDRKLLSELQPAGIAVFRKNFDHGSTYEHWHARFTALVEAAREAIGRKEILVCIDHEGGTVMRAPAPITPFAFARSWAGCAGNVGRAMGVELASLGINVNFAPVLDIDSNPKNPVIGPRSFASSAEEVEAAGRAFILGLQENGVLACPKHFPGHGDTHADSHHGLPVLDADVEMLESRELKPFAAIIRDGISLIMTAHILFPKIDPVYPATLSPHIVKAVLRDRLQYRGVVVTDDIGMHAVSGLFDHPAACAQAVSSGTDLLLLHCHWTDTNRAYKMVADMERALDSGLLKSDVLEASDRRIDSLLAQLPVNTPYLLDREVFAAHAALAPLSERKEVAGGWVSLK